MSVPLAGRDSTVKATLTVVRAHRENPEYAAMMGRMLAAWTRRVADGDPGDLTDLLTAARLLDEGIRAAVTGQRATYGTSWAAIGEAAGVTRQAAQQRWATP
jgi:hypothetical protein